MKNSENLNIYFTISVTYDKKVGPKIDFFESRFGVLRSQGVQKYMYVLVLFLKICLGRPRWSLCAPILLSEIPFRPVDPNTNNKLRP